MDVVLNWFVQGVIVAILALAVGISTLVTVYRIGDSGAHAVWGGQVVQAGD